MGASSAELPSRASLLTSAAGEEIARKTRSTPEAPNADASKSNSPAFRLPSSAEIISHSSDTGDNKTAEEDQAYDALKAIRAQADAIARLVERYKQTLERLGRFFKSEDLGNPPGPLEIQARLVESAHADADIPSPKTALSAKAVEEDPPPAIPTDEVGINVLV